MVCGLIGSYESGILVLVAISQCERHSEQAVTRNVHVWVRGPEVNFDGIRASFASLTHVVAVLPSDMPPLIAKELPRVPTLAFRLNSMLSTTTCRPACTCRPAGQANRLSMAPICSA